MDKKEVGSKKAAERLQRLLNADFDGMKLEIEIDYKNKGKENGET